MPKPLSDTFGAPVGVCAYVVRDDAIAEETVLRAVHEVRSCGGNKQFDLTTTTQYVAPQVPKAGKPTTREIARQALIGQSNPNTSGATVSRPNWLKITSSANSMRISWLCSSAM